MLCNKKKKCFTSEIKKNKKLFQMRFKRFLYQLKNPAVEEFKKISRLNEEFFLGISNAPIILNKRLCWNC